MAPSPYAVILPSIRFRRPPCAIRSIGPLDLADHRCVHPTAARPGPDRRPAPPMGTTGHHARPVDPGPGPTEISSPPHEDAPAGRCAETHPTGARPSTRLPQQAGRRTPTRRQNPNTRTRQGALNTPKRFKTSSGLRTVAHRLLLTHRSHARKSSISALGQRDGRRPWTGVDLRACLGTDSVRVVTRQPPGHDDDH